MEYIKNLHENEFGELEGEVYFNYIGKYITIEIEEDVPQDYVDKQVKYLNSVDEDIILCLCENSLKFCMAEMKEYPNKGYSEGLFEVSQVKDILKFMDVMRLRVDMCEEEDADTNVLNLSGSCEWDKENGIQWLIKENEVIYVGRWDDLNIFYSDVSDPICNYVLR